ncbi:MAG: FAD-dependent oxidoreductase [Myxococcota bacterium]
MRVAILGGGIAGLACAHYLAKGGHTPVVLETSAWLGQLGAPIEHEGLRLDGTSLAIRNGDTALCGLLGELGGLGRISWRETRSSVAVGGKHYPVTAARDLLRLLGLGNKSRLRAALGLAYATQLKRYALHLDSIPASDWLPRVFGRPVYEAWWRPLLESRFGEYVDEVPAYWAWRQLNAYQTGRREVFGYLRGGAAWLAERLRRSIETRGGEVRLHARVTAVETGGAHASVELDGQEERFDDVICTLAPGDLAKLARARLAHDLPNLDVPYQGRVTALLVSRRKLGDYYQTALVGNDLMFQQVIEATNVVSNESYDGRHLIYVRGDCGPHTDTFKLPDDVVKKQALETIARWFPSFDASALEAVHVSRDSHAEPITLLGQLKRRLPTRIGDSRVLLCSSAQAYPRRVGWDADVTLARETAAAV